MNKINAEQKNSRIGLEKYNNQGYLMKIISYQNSENIIVEFQDEIKTTKRSRWAAFNSGAIKNPNYRLFLTNYNTQGCLMKVVEYNSAWDMTIEFQDKYKTKIKTHWNEFKSGGIKNPYHPTVFGVGITGNKYPTIYKDSNGEKHDTKEYRTWVSVLQRSFSQKEKDRYPTYNEVTCCSEWLLYDNFYEWLHSQENFEKWKVLKKSGIDKDIIQKGNKLYSPENCCLVPVNVNNLFVKSDAIRGDLPIGVVKKGNRYRAQLLKGDDYTFYPNRATSYDAFIDYKQNKEKWVKQVAQEEYKKGNISKRCYDAMMNYQVEITD